MAEALVVQAGGFGAVTKAVEGFSGFAGQYEQTGKVSAHHDNFREVPLHGQIGPYPAVMFDLPRSWSSPIRPGTEGCLMRSRAPSGTRQAR
jgi:hypothetical protein